MVSCLQLSDFCCPAPAPIPESYSGQSKKSFLSMELTNVERGSRRFSAPMSDFLQRENLQKFISAEAPPPTFTYLNYDREYLRSTDESGLDLSIPDNPRSSLLLWSSPRYEFLRIASELALGTLGRSGPLGSHVHGNRGFSSREPFPSIFIIYSRKNADDWFIDTESEPTSCHGEVHEKKNKKIIEKNG